MKKKIKNALLVVLTLALAATVSVAFTLALVEGSMGSATNTFTNETITVQLSEVKWDGNKGQNDTDGDIPENKGEDIAKSYSAGQTIPKNPKLSNISDLSDGATVDPQEWVAIKLTYTATAQVNGETKNYTYDSYDEFLRATGAQVKVGTSTDGFNTTNWEAKNSANTVFYYKAKLDNKASTETLFDNVYINALTQRESKYVMYDNSGSEVLADSLPQFEIKLEGYAVQAEGVEYATAKTELDKLM